MKKVYLCAIVLLTTLGLVGVADRSTAQSKSADLLTNKQVEEMVTNAKTPAQHAALAKHYNAVAARYEADAADHVELAAAYRKSPIGRAESKSPGGPETAAHCDRFAAAARDAAKEARALASEHEHMASEASKASH